MVALFQILNSRPVVGHTCLRKMFQEATSGHTFHSNDVPEPHIALRDKQDGKRSLKRPEIVAPFNDPPCHPLMHDGTELGGGGHLLQWIEFFIRQKGFPTLIKVYVLPWFFDLGELYISQNTTRGDE